MFRTSYQGGAVFDIFSGHGKDPVAKWKLSGGPSSIYKEYNKEVKGFVYCLEGSSQTVKMQMPDNAKMSLGLIQRFLVLQVNIPRCHDFSTELVITDSEHLKRRLHFSTVHKELSATLLHARIPLAELKRDTWSTLCIDLVSLTEELFKRFLTLDGITLFATCKVRRIFTMKTDPGLMSQDDVFLNGASLMDTIPHGFRYPPDVNQTTHVLSIDNLRRAEMKTDPFNSSSVPDQSPIATSTRDRRTKPQGVLHTASGSRTPTLSPQTGRKSSAPSEGMERNNRSDPRGMDSEVLQMSGDTQHQDMSRSSFKFCSVRHEGSPSNRVNRRMTTEGHNITKISENSSHGQRSHILHEGASCKLQPRPPQRRLHGKQGCKKPQIRSARRERLPSSAPPGVESGVQRRTGVSRDKHTLPSSLQKNKLQPLTPTEKSEHLTTDESGRSPEKESPGAAAAPAESQLRPSLSPDLRGWNSWESNEGSEPQLALHGEAFTFSSLPHSPKRGQSQGDQEKMEMGDDQVQRKRGGRYHAQPEDDFIGSESDEDKSYTVFHYQKTSMSAAAAPRPVQLQHHPESRSVNQGSPKQHTPNTCVQFPSRGGAESAAMVPTRCLSPNRRDLKLEKGNHVLGGNSSVSLCRKLLQEVQLGDSKQHKEEEEEPLKSVSCHYVLQPHASIQMCEDDDQELQMLASLKREQEEDECQAQSLSASQIHRCNVSISLSSDDTSTWTHLSMPVNQGHHYQTEMDPFFQSNPREWMDVLSPPIMPPSQQRRSGYTQNNLERLVRGEDGLVKEEENEDEYLKLLYDPCLNCYFDPKTGKYYELA